MFDSAENPWLDDDLIERRRQQRRWLRSVASVVFDLYQSPDAPTLEDEAERTLAERLLREHAAAELESSRDWDSFVHEEAMQREVIGELGDVDPYIGSAEAPILEPLRERFPQPTGPLVTFDDATMTAFFHRVVVPLIWADLLAADGYMDARAKVGPPG